VFVSYQASYNNHWVSVNLDTEVWVCISDQEPYLFHHRKFIIRDKCYDTNLDIIQTKVRELLIGKVKYLLVLDDVWKRNYKLEFGLSYEN